VLALDHDCLQYVVIVGLHHNVIRPTLITIKIFCLIKRDWKIRITKENVDRQRRLHCVCCVKPQRRNVQNIALHNIVNNIVGKQKL
jgi:hypothetical protein